MRWLILTGLVLVIAAVLGLASSSTSGQAQGKIVCIDPGHGGTESGAIYQKQGRDPWTLVEKEINLDVATELRAKLEAVGVSVVMTREDDSTVELQPRAKTCNDSEADITVSVHTNSIRSPRWDGSLTLMNKDPDWPLAEAMQRVMYNGLQEGWDGLFTDYGINVGEWTIPKYTEMPAVILEPVFMSNRDEAAALRATIGQAPNGRRGQIAQVEYAGILAYFASQ